MSETETNTAKLVLEQTFSDQDNPRKERQIQFMNDKSERVESIELSTQGSIHKNKGISRSTRNELTRFTENVKTKPQINGHKLSVVNPPVQVRILKILFILVSAKYNILTRL